MTKRRGRGATNKVEKVEKRDQPGPGEAETPNNESGGTRVMNIMLAKLD
jgi:hypothetical protein